MKDVFGLTCISGKMCQNGASQVREESWGSSEDRCTHDHSKYDHEDDHGIRLGEMNEKRAISNNVDHGLSILHLPKASERILNQKKHRSGMEQTRSVIHVVVYAAALGTVWYARGECTVLTYGTLDLRLTIQESIDSLVPPRLLATDVNMC